MGFFYILVCVCFECFFYFVFFVEDGLFGCREFVGIGDYCFGFLDLVYGFWDGDFVWCLYCGIFLLF